METFAGTFVVWFCLWQYNYGTCSNRARIPEIFNIKIPLCKEIAEHFLPVVQYVFLRANARTHLHLHTLLSSLLLTGQW